MQPTTTMHVDPNYVAPKKDRLEGLIMGWVDNHGHRDELLAEIRRLWDIEENLGREYWRQVRNAAWRRLPLWLVTLILKVQLFLHAVANPRRQ
jgi:hypothetical protein